MNDGKNFRSFIDAADLYGADVAHWPAHIKDMAQAERDNPRLAGLLDQAARVEKRLRSLPAPAAPDMALMHRRVLDRIHGNVVRIDDFIRPRAAVASSLALMAAAIAGIFLGVGYDSGDFVLDPSFYAAQEMVISDIDDGDIL